MTVGVAGGFLIVSVSAAVAVTLQPLQYRMVQLLEGYWFAKPLGLPYRMGVWWQRRRCERLQRQLTGEEPRTVVGKRLRDERRLYAEVALRSQIPDSNRILPTTLGNILRSMEDSAGARYGIEAVPLWSRLYPVLPRDHAKSLENEVTQLDMSSRLALTWAVTALICGTLLLFHPAEAARNPRWGAVVVALFLASWLSYRGAIESALAHSSDVAITFDLYRDYLLDAARMPQVARLSLEPDAFEMLCRLYESQGPNHGVNFDFRERTLSAPVTGSDQPPE